MTCTHASESDCRHQPTVVALLSHVPSDHIGTKREPYAQERHFWVLCPDVQHCGTVIFGVACRIQLGACDRNPRTCETDEGWW